MAAAALDADVVIAGAGMAGATLGLALHQGGLKVILVDPQPFSVQLEETFDGRSCAISFSSFRQWRALGLEDAFAPHAERIEQILVTDGHSPGAASPAPSPVWLRFDAAEIADRCEGEPLGYMLENRQTRAGLSKALEDAGIPVLAPAEVTAVETAGASAVVRLADGRELRVALVVGADGRGSRVRQEAGIGVTRLEYKQCGVVCTVALEQSHQGVAYEYFLPSGPFAILPLTDNRASLVWTESPSRAAALKAARPEAFAAYLRRRFGDFLGEITLVGPRFVYPLSLQLADKLTAPRVVLMGDAAHGIHPIAGQGLNLGLKDAAALAQVLIEAARLGEDIGSEAVLDRYARWRGFDNVSLALIFDLFTRLFSNDNPIVRAARGAGIALVNRIGPARRLFMTEAGGAVGDLPRLLRGEAI